MRVLNGEKRQSELEREREEDRDREMYVCVCVCQTECSSNSCQEIRSQRQLAASSAKHCHSNYSNIYLRKIKCQVCVCMCVRVYACVYESECLQKLHNDDKYKHAQTQTTHTFTPLLPLIAG